VPGVLGESTSTDEESFSAGLLEYPQYTRPAEFRGREVPAVLQGGNHARVRAWRARRAIELTCARRPDLLARAAAAGQAAAAELAARTSVALVHHPVYDRTGAVVTSAVTNMDIHDIARSAATYGLAGYYAVTPVAAQRDKIERIVSAWPEQGGRGRGDGDEPRPDHRAEALSLIRVAPSIEEVVGELTRGAVAPLVVGTSADAGRAPEVPRVGFDWLRAEAVAADGRPVLLLFGTGWGLTESVIANCSCVLAPIRGRPAFNHLCVRSALAIVLDRLFGLRA
jgi:tRNA (guanine37-N1)-methyltransferase